MKVIIFLFDPNVGGPTVRARLVSSELSQHDMSVQFALPKTHGSAREFLEKDGFKVYDLGIAKPTLPKRPIMFLQFLLRAPYDLAKLYSFLRREKPDVIHVNGAFDILPVIAANIAGTSVLWHLNDMVFSAKLSKIFGFFVRKLASLVALTSSSVGVHYGIDEKDAVMLPVPVGSSPRNSKKTTIPPPIKISLVGNWNPLKGQDDFVKIISQLRSDGYDVKGQLFGRLLESQTAYWKPIVDRINSGPLADHIEIAGFVEDVAGALAESDISLITSVTEAGPLSCVEALALGVPVVSYDVGDVKKMTDCNGERQCGIVVPQRDTKKMADAVKELINSTKLHSQYSKNGPQHVARYYSVTAAANATKQAYERAV